MARVFFAVMRPFLGLIVVQGTAGKAESFLAAVMIFCENVFAGTKPYAHSQHPGEANSAA